MDGALASEMLPTADRNIDIKRIEFHPATDPTDALGSQKRRMLTKFEEHLMNQRGRLERVPGCLRRQFCLRDRPKLVIDLFGQFVRRRRWRRGGGLRPWVLHSRSITASCGNDLALVGYPAGLQNRVVV